MMSLNGDVFQSLAPDTIDNAIEPHHLFDHCICVWHVLQHIICASDAETLGASECIVHSTTREKASCASSAQTVQGIETCTLGRQQHHDDNGNLCLLLQMACATRAAVQDDCKTGSRRPIVQVIASPWRLMTLACSALSCFRMWGCFCSSGRTRDRVAPVVSCPAGSQAPFHCMHHDHIAFAGHVKPFQGVSCKCRGRQHTAVLRSGQTRITGWGGGPTCKELREDLVLELLHAELQGQTAGVNALT